MSLDQVFRVFVASAAMVVVTSTGAGCGGNVVVDDGTGGSHGTTSSTSTPTSTLNKCEQAAADIIAKVEACGGTITGTGTGTVTCSEKDGQLSQCVAACFVATSCDCIGVGSTSNCTPEEQSNYADCIVACQ